MSHRMLIIDDEMPERKGYGRIEECYPGVFEIDVSRYFVMFNHDETAAFQRLLAWPYELVLLDCAFSVHPEQGLDIALAIRRGFSPINTHTFIIGTSVSWDEKSQRALLRGLRNFPGDRGFDGWTGKGRDDARGLFEELDKFLRSRGVDPETVRRK